MVLESGESVEQIQWLRELVDDTLPADGVVLVAGGQDELLRLGARVTWHFPQTEGGTYGGEPSTTLSAIAHLEALRARGAAYLVLPRSTLGWLEENKPFRHYLERHYRLLLDEEGACVVFALQDSSGSRSETIATAMEGVITDFQSRFGRDPAILDWTRGLRLAANLPQHAVFSPVLPDVALPYLAHTIDLVVTRPDDSIYLAEARRVASAAVVTVSAAPAILEAGDSQSRYAVEREWQTEVAEAGPPAVSIIIPLYNGSESPGASVRALSKTLPKSFRGEIILSADASIGETPAIPDDCGWLSERASVVHEPEAVGIAAACSRAAKDAAGEILVVLANESLPLPGWMPFLLRTFREREEAGVVGGKIISPDGCLREAGGVIRSDGSAAPLGAGERAADDPAYSFLREVDYCSLPFLATRRTVFHALEGFRSRCSPHEAIDYCQRVRGQGWKVYYQPRIAVVHPVVHVPGAVPATLGAEG